MPSCCMPGGCGRKDLENMAPGLELFNGKYSCTLCIVNPTRFKQPNFKKQRTKAPQAAVPLDPAAKTKEHDIFGEIDD